MTAAIHMSKKIPPIDWTDVPEAYKGQCSAVVRSALECEDLVRWFGSPDFCPFLPVLILLPGADAPIAITGMGYATAAELRDCAVVTWHDKTEKLANGGKLLDFDALREKRGLMRREEVDPAVRQALRDRVAKHKANPISDPARQPVYPNPTNKTRFPISEVLDG